MDEEKYLNAVSEAFKYVYSNKYIRTEIIAKAELVTLMQLNRVVTERVRN